MNKSQNDLCDWLVDAIEATQGIKLNWRSIKKFINDFEYDHCCKLSLTHDPELVKARLFEIYDQKGIVNIEH